MRESGNIDPSFRNTRLAAVGAAVTLAIGLAACGGGGDQEPADPTANDSSTTTHVALDAMPYYVDTQQSFYANVQETLDSGDYPEATAELEALLEMPAATWLGTWMSESPETLNQDTKAYVAEVTNDAANRQEMPAFVLYNIPDLDLGGYSAGGLNSTDDYNKWTESISKGIGDNPAVVIIEPDALAGVPEMTDAEGATRISLLRETLTLFKENNPSAIVYLDAGHDAWLTPEEAADLIQRVDDGKDLVGGISLNVSSFGTTENIAAYSEEIKDILGTNDMKVLIDTGLNGATVELDRNDWCNNRGVRINHADNIYGPTNTLEMLTVKPAGESGGECDKGDDAAGEFNSELLMTQLGHPTGQYAK